MIRSIWRSLVVASLALPCTALAATPLVIEPRATLSVPDTHYDIVESVGMDGDFLVMGAAGYFDDFERGPYADVAAFIFQRQPNGTWTNIQRLLTDTGGVGLRISSAIRGNIAAVHFSSRLWVFERTASGTWQSSPVHPDFSYPYGSPTVIDLEIEGNTIIFGGGPLTFAGGCDSYNVRAFRKNSSGVWAPVGTVASSDPAPPELSCLQSDVATSGNLTVLAADPLADGSRAAYFFTGPPGAWRNRIRISGYGDPVALSNGTAVLSGTEVFRQSSGTWGRTQTLYRPDRLIQPPLTTELRNSFAAVAFTSSVSVYQADAANHYTEVARLNRAGGDIGSTSVDISGRRVVANGVYEGKAYVFELPTSFSQPALIQETFEIGNAAGWTPLAGSAWSVTATPASRVYRQTSLAGDAGSFLDNTDWTNQSIQADITPTAFSGSDRWFGLTVRRADAANYYYVTARSSNVLQLKKIINGAFQTLASAPLLVATNTPYRLRLEAIGTTLRVYVSDQMLLQAVDSSISHGSAGLLMYKTAANYDNVVVSPSPQVTLLADSFQFNTAPFWTPILGTWSTPPVYAQSSTAGDALSVTGISTDNQSLQARARATSFAAVSGDRWFGLFARYQDQRDYYYVTLRSSNVVSLRKVAGGSIFVLDSAPFTVTTGTWYTLRLEALKDQLRVYVNGTPVLEATDSAFQQGRYGAVMYRAAAEYDDVLLTQP